MIPLHDAVLHVDDEQCGVRPVVECGYGVSLLMMGLVSTHGGPIQRIRARRSWVGTSQKVCPAKFVSALDWVVSVKCGAVGTLVHAPNSFTIEQGRTRDDVLTSTRPSHAPQLRDRRDPGPRSPARQQQCERDAGEVGDRRAGVLGRDSAMHVYRLHPTGSGLRDDPDVSVVKSAYLADRDSLPDASAAKRHGRESERCSRSAVRWFSSDRVRPWL